MTALSEILGINKLINAAKIGIKTKAGKYTTLDKYLKKYKNIIYDLTLQTDSNHVSIPCDILRDGGNYELWCIGRITSGQSDVSLRLNNVSNDIYYQSGFSYNFNGQNTDTTGTLWQGFRPAKNSFYICSGWYSNANSRGISKYTISLLKANDYPCMTLENNRTFTTFSVSGQASCQSSVSFENITSIDLLPTNGSNSFAVGTRFILRKL